MPDGRYKFPTMNDVESGAVPLDQRQFLRDGLDRLHNAPVYLNGQLAEIVKLLAPPLTSSAFNPLVAKWGFLFKDGHAEYATIKQINITTSAEPRIDIITEEPPERAS